MTIPEAATTSGFPAVLRERGGEEVVRWTHPQKLGRMESVAEFFAAEGVETEGECGANIAKLAAVRGIGPKTIDYFNILCGEQDTAAIDMHLTRFLEQAGVRVVRAMSRHVRWSRGRRRSSVCPPPSSTTASGRT